MARKKVASSETRFARRVKRVRAFLEKHGISRRSRTDLKRVLIFVIPLLDKLLFTVYEDEKELWFLHGRPQACQEGYKPFLQVTLSVRVTHAGSVRLSVSLYSSVDQEHAIMAWKAMDQGCVWQTTLPEESLRDRAFSRAVDELREREKPAYKDATVRRNIRFFVRKVLRQGEEEGRPTKKLRRANKKRRRS